MNSILVMGASRGIGLELVRQYTDAGRRVIATVRDDAGRERVLALGAEALTVDVANPASVSGLAWQLDGEKLDLALYVAGVIRRPNALTPPTQQNYHAVMHTNVLGAMQAIPQQQWEAAESLGLTPVERLRWIIIPQAVRISMPSTVASIATSVTSTAEAW